MPIVQLPVLTVRLKNAKLSTMALNRIGLDAEKVVRKVFKATTLKVAETMQVEGKPPTYPIQWDSPKQRRAFFATNGFGGGIPHIRRGEYVAAWKQQTIRGGYQVANKLRHAGFIAGDIQGKRQSRIHKGRWPIFRKIVDRALKLIPKQVVSDLKITIRKLGFRVKE
jgi:hypothetical protein